MSRSRPVQALIQVGTLSNFTCLLEASGSPESVWKKTTKQCCWIQGDMDNCIVPVLLCSSLSYPLRSYLQVWKPVWVLGTPLVIPLHFDLPTKAVENYPSLKLPARSYWLNQAIPLGLSVRVKQRMRDFSLCVFPCLGN